MIIFPRFEKSLVGKTNFSELITELLQKGQILTNNFMVKTIFSFSFILIYFFLQWIWLWKKHSHKNFSYIIEYLLFFYSFALILKQNSLLYLAITLLSHDISIHQTAINFALLFHYSYQLITGRIRFLFWLTCVILQKNRRILGNIIASYKVEKWNNVINEASRLEQEERYLHLVKCN